MQETDLIKRLAVLFSEHDTTNFNVLDYVYAVGSPLQALMYLKLFWPEFVEIEEMIFLKDNIENEENRRSVLEYFNEHNRDRLSTEQAFNLLEIPSDIFGKNMGETTDEEDQYLAVKLVEMWQYRLHLVYPSRSFKVELLAAEETGGEIGILFYQSET